MSPRLGRVAQVGLALWLIVVAVAIANLVVGWVS